MLSPPSYAQSDLHFTNTNIDENWIPTKLYIISWVTFIARSNSGHAKDSKKHGGPQHGQIL